MKTVAKTDVVMTTKLKLIAAALVRRQLNVGHGYNVCLSDDIQVERSTNEDATATYTTTLKGRTGDHRRIEFVAEYQNIDNQLQFTLRYIAAKSSITSITPVTEMIDLGAYINWCDGIAKTKVVKKDESKDEIINKRIVPIIAKKVQKVIPDWPIKHLTKTVEEIIQHNPRQDGINVEEYVNIVTCIVETVFTHVTNAHIQTIRDYCATPNDVNLHNAANALTALSEYKQHQYNLYRQIVNIVKYITDINKDQNSSHLIRILKDASTHYAKVYIAIELKQPVTPYPRIDLQQVNESIEIKFNPILLLKDSTGMLKVATEFFELLNDLQQLNHEKNPIDLIYEMIYPDHI